MVSSLLKKRLTKQAYNADKPVIVVGNISVGGTGKTPLVIALVEHFAKQGKRAGVISRGYKGEAVYPYAVQATSNAKQCGDEPLLIYHRCGCPVVVDPDRVAAAKYLTTHFEVDVIISDDGLQHYRLGRQCEIAVVDSARGLGNGYLLPAGPLRELPKRLAQVDFVVVNGESTAFSYSGAYTMQLVVGDLSPIGNTKIAAPTKGKVHAVAAIGNPERFFTSLRAQGFDVIPHAFPDHYLYQRDDVIFEDNLPVIMTEKDWVKCREFSNLCSHWCMPVNASLPEGFLSKIK